MRCDELIEFEFGNENEENDMFGSVGECFEDDDEHMAMAMCASQTLRLFVSMIVGDFAFIYLLH